MPAGVGWGQYLRFSLSAALCMMAGSQLVHHYYQPLRDLNDYLNRELRSLPPDIQDKIRKELTDEHVLNSESGL